jgi:phosphoribosylamine-glycine ligase
MRVAFHTKEMSSLAWAIRLKDEGHDVLVYTPPNSQRVKSNRRIGDGLVNKAISRDQWLGFGLDDPSTLWFFDCTDHGELADRLRATGKRVVGAGSFMDKLENDRGFGTAFAQRCGMQCPPERRFTSISGAIAWLKTNPRQQIGDGGWAWKPYQDLGPETSICVGSADEAIDELHNVMRRKGDTHTGIVQERINGVALSTARWFNGAGFTGPFEGTLEKKKLMNGDLGPATGCSLNLVWMYQQRYPRIAEALNWECFEDRLRQAQAPPGIYDINAIVNADGAWFLEHTPRLGIDAQLASQRAYEDLGEFLVRLATGKAVDELVDSDQNYLSVRLTVPPYPNDDFTLEQSPAMGVSIRGIDGLWDKHFVAVGVALGPHGYEVADPYGFVGVALTTGDDLGEMGDELMDCCKQLRIRGLQYRTDVVDVISTDLTKMDTTGWPVTEVLEDAAA